MPDPKKPTEDMVEIVLTGNGPSAIDIAAVQSILLIYFFYLHPEPVTHKPAEYIFRRCPDMERRG